MCDKTAYEHNLERLKTYLEFVNTDIGTKMAFEPELYAAYATLQPRLGIESIRGWYREAEDCFISAFGIDLYLMGRYDIDSEDDLDYYFEKEVYREGRVYECGGYWFTNGRN